MTFAEAARIQGYQATNTRWNYKMPNSSSMFGKIMSGSVFEKRRTAIGTAQGYDHEDKWLNGKGKPS